MCGLRTRPRTDVDPPIFATVELPSVGGHIVSPPRRDTLYECHFNVSLAQCTTFLQLFCGGPERHDLEVPVDISAI